MVKNEIVLFDPYSNTRWWWGWGSSQSGQCTFKNVSLRWMPSLISLLLDIKVLDAFKAAIITHA